MKKIVFFSLMIFAFLGCSDDDVPTFSFETIAVSNIVGIPEVFVVGETVNFDLSYFRPSTCHSFEGIEVEVVDENTRNIAILNRLVEGRAPCRDLTDEELSTSLQFTPVQSGEVTLNFLNGTDASGAPVFVTFNVPVIE